MLNTPRFNSTSIHQRFSRQLSAMTAATVKPSLQVLAGASRIDAGIIEATGHDVHISLKTPLELRQRVVVVFRSAIPSLDVAIPGVVHWNNSKAAPAEIGIALQEPIPDELTVRQPGCTRNNIRFACKVHGTLKWTQTAASATPGMKAPSEISVSATAMNYSRDGFCVQLDKEPTIGTHVEYSWQNDRTALKVHGIVRWVIGQSGGAMAGCELIDSKGYMLGSGVDV